MWEEETKYYQSSQWLYRLFCYNQQTLGMHFGFWDKHTRNRQQAILNENEQVIRKGKIKKGMKVLDAGCGVGGTAIYIAKKTQARVWGITIDPQQAATACKNAISQGLKSKLSISVQDFTRTNFADGFFDVVYGIESICYSTPKLAFLTEARRILKRGGRLVVADGYLSRHPKNNHEVSLINIFKWSFALKELITKNEMFRQFKQAGYSKIRGYSFINAVEPSINHFASLQRRTRFLAALAKYLPWEKARAIYRNSQALKTTKILHVQGLSSYYVHVAVK